MVNPKTHHLAKAINCFVADVSHPHGHFWEMALIFLYSQACFLRKQWFYFVEVF